MKRLLCLAVFLFLPVAPLICQDPPDYSDHFNQGMFDVYLQRAGEESSRQTWKELADYGIRAVVRAWERRFLALILDPAEFARQRELLRRNLAQEAEERFADWLVRGFFAEVGDQTLAALLEEAGRRGRQYLFLSDEAGNLLYDEAGGPVLRGTRDGEQDTHARDRGDWGSAMGDRMGALPVR